MMKNIFFLLFLFASHSLISQFSNLKYKQGKNLIHNSIAKSKTSSNFYAVASTIQYGDDCDINIAKMDANGVTLWEREIDVMQDDRVLDVMVDKEDNIVLVGYVGDEHLKQLYIAKYNSSGGLINDFVLNSEFNTVGTTIIQSEFSENYFVGGYTYSDSRPYDMESYALLISVDEKIENLNWETEYSRSKINNTITDILELPNQNLFITGSLGQDITGQVVLAAFVNPLSHGEVMIDGNLSFGLTQDHCLGASAVYDAVSDEIWLLLNAGDDGKPHFIGIKKASTTGPLLFNTGRILDINNTPKDKYAAYKIMLSPSNSNGLSIFGYKDHAERYNAGFGLWAIDVNKTTAMINGGLKTWVPSGPTINLEFQGGDILSLFSQVSNTGMPYFHTPSMAIESHDGSRFVALTMDDISGNTEMGVLSFGNNLLYASSPCLKFLDPVNTTFTTYPKELYFSSNSHSVSKVNAKPIVASIYGQSYCSINYIAAGGSSSDEKGDITNNQLSQNNKAMSLYPNPTNGNITVSVLDGNTIKGLKLINELGQVVMEMSMTDMKNKISLDMSKLENGVYNMIAIGQDDDIMHERIVKL